MNQVYTRDMAKKFIQLAKKSLIFRARFSETAVIKVISDAKPMEFQLHYYLKYLLAVASLSLSSCYENELPDLILSEDSVTESKYRGTFAVKFTLNNAAVDTATLTVDSTFVLSHLPNQTGIVEMKYLHIGKSVSSEYFYFMPSYDITEQSFGYYDKKHDMWDGVVYSNDNKSYRITSTQRLK